MMNTVWAIVREGIIQPEEPIELHDGQRVLLTVIADDEERFWLGAVGSTLDGIWGNEEDDVYAELLAA